MIRTPQPIFQIAIALLLAFAWGLTACAQESAPTNAFEFPDSQRGARMAGFFAAYDSGSREDYAAWLTTNRTAEALVAAPLEARLQYFEDEIAQNGSLAPALIEEIDEDTTGIYAQWSGSGNWIRVAFTFVPEENDLIGPVQIVPAAGPGELIALDPTWSSLAELGQQILDLTGTPAIALGIYHNGEIVDQSVVGIRMVGDDTPAQLSDTFHWGSIGKAVTGTMIAALIEDGLLNWDSTLGELLPDVPMREEFRRATITQVMNHQAGLPTYTDINLDLAEQLAALSGDTAMEQRAAFAARVLMEDPVGLPGEVGAYSNAGPVIAAYTAERLTGQSWRELVQTRVYDPAGMTTAGFDWPSAPDRLDQPRGHFLTPEGLIPRALDEFNDIQGTLDPAGNVRSSIADLLRFGAVHVEGLRGNPSILEPGTMQRLHTPLADGVPVEGSPYTFGWGIGCPNVPPEIACQWHNGSAGTFYAEIWILPEEDIVLAFMTNSMGPAAVLANEALTQMLLHTL